MDKAMLLLQSVAGTQQKRMAPKSFEKDAVKAGAQQWQAVAVDGEC